MKEDTKNFLIDYQKEYIEMCEQLINQFDKNDAITFYLLLFEFQYQVYERSVKKYKQDKKIATQNALTFIEYNYNIWSILFNKTYKIVQQYNISSGDREFIEELKNEDFEMIEALAKSEKVYKDNMYSLKENVFFENILNEIKTYLEKYIDINISESSVIKIENKYQDIILKIKEKLSNNILIA